MFALSPATRIYLVPGVTDMRKSFDTLHALVDSQVKVAPLSGHLFLFCNRRRDRLKILFWDGSGLWVCAKRLEKGTFWWPAAAKESSSVECKQTQLNLLLSGIDLAQTKERTWWRRDHSQTNSKQVP